MFDSILNDSMDGGKITSSFCCKGDNNCLPRHKRDGFSPLIIIAPIDFETT